MSASFASNATDARPRPALQPDNAGIADPVAAQLARLAVRVDVQTIDEATRRKVGLCLLDFFAAALAGAGQPWSVHAVAAALADGAQGSCAIVGTGHRVGAGSAAFANAVLGGSTWQMDTYADSATHPGVAIIPAALACAQAHRVDGRTLMAGLLAGYEVAGELGDLLYRGAARFSLRPSGVTSPIAAASACAHILGFSLEDTVYAIGMGAQCSAGLMEGSRSGTGELAYHASFAARNGIAAAELVRAGAIAAPTALDGPLGIIPLMVPEARGRSLPVDRPSGRWRILDVLHKPVAACVYVQSPCQVALEIASRPGFNADRIRAVRLAAHPTAIGFPGCDNPKPVVSPQQARLSIQYSLASVLRERAIDVRSWLSPSNAPELTALAARCAVSARDDLAVQGCELEVEIDSGEVLRGSATTIREPSDADLIDRFRRAAHGRIERERSDQVVAWALDLRSLPDLNALTTALQIR